MRRHVVLLLITLGVPAAGQKAEFHTGKLHGRDAWTLENGRMRASTLRGGGFIGEIRLKSADAKKSINPMRVPDYQTIDPYKYNDAVDNAIYGDSGQRGLQSGYMGHFLCFPNYGAPSEAELKAGLQIHGEAVLVEWKQDGVEVRDDGVTFRYSADLPRTQFRVGRALTLRSGETVLYIDEWVENLAPYDRPVNWVEHVTFGPPFVAPGRNYVDAPVVKVASGKGEPASWPDLRLMTATPHSSRYNALLLDPARPKSYFTMFNPDYRFLIGYIFYTSEDPWIADWQENQRVTALPQAGKVIARGLEVGSTPYAEGIHKSVDRGQLFGVKTYRWIGARQRLRQSYVAFLAEIPAGFRGVANVESREGRIAIEERGTGSIITVPSGRAW
ncbi:MAG: aldose 1-epimerase family protein [Acidobacteria bacterium]|nr:aldose 1-epimerase family protein [Acidobacteriota bacterium]